MKRKSEEQKTAYEEKHDIHMTRRMMPGTEGKVKTKASPNVGLSVFFFTFVRCFWSPHRSWTKGSLPRFFVSDGSHAGRFDARRIVIVVT